MSEARDRKVIKDAESALDKLFEKYAASSPADKWILKPAIKNASKELLEARLALFKEGVLTTKEDVAQLEEIHKEIDGAAQSQAIAMSALKLAGFLGVFA